MAVRVQRKRTKGWKMPPKTVYVGRPTKWGNPYIPDSADEAQEAVDSYRAHLVMMVRRGELDLAELRGKDLACWCPLDRPCHADVLLELANMPGVIEAIADWRKR